METVLTSPALWMLGSGLLIGRVVIGTLMMAHAGEKLFGWLGGQGLRGTAGFFEHIGFRPGLRFAAAASLIEMISGLLVMLWAPRPGRSCAVDFHHDRCGGERSPG
jgi:hypothetical protein